MKRRILNPLLGAAVVGGAILGCEPSSITAAREQLARGTPDTIGYVVPLVDTSFSVSEFLDNADIVSTPDGLLSLRVQTEDVQFDFADVLASAAITTSVGFPSPGMKAPGDLRDTLRFSTPAGSQVVGATMSSGSVTRTITNGTTCDATVTVSLVDSLTNTVVAGFATNVLLTAGSSTLETVNLNGSSFVQFVEIDPTANLTSCGAPGGNVSASLSFTQATLTSVDLDNLSESFTVEEAEELQRSDFEFDELDSLINQSTLNSATIDMTVTNTADAPVVLNNVTIGAVQIDTVTGQLMRDGGGNLIFETDGAGNPIQVPIADPGQTTLSVPRNGSANVTAAAAALVDRVTHILLDADSLRVAFVASGTAESNDGSSGRILIGDMVDVQYSVVVGLDFTIPLTGVQFNVDNTVTNGVGLDTAEIDDIEDRLVSIAGVARAENFTAFGIEVTAAFAPDSLDPAVDVFTQPGGFQLTPITVSAPAVDAAGIPQGSVIDSVGISITAPEARVLLGDKFTAGIRIRLLPGTGGNGRGAIRPGDRIDISAAATILIERGGQ